MTEPSEENDWAVRYQDLLAEFEEFRAGSRELETELEGQVQESERQLQELRRQQAAQQDRLEQFAARERSQNQQLTEQQALIQKQARTEEAQRRRITELEQENDLLQQRARESAAQVEDLSARFHRVVEQQAYTQTELEEARSSAAEQIQRLKEEIRGACVCSFGVGFSLLFFFFFFALRTGD
jgi:dGTP triphosphohydrolase